MSDKYIIKNCPCYDTEYEECLNTFRDEYKKCYDRTDCVMKRIVDDCLDNEKYGDAYYTRHILEKLDIQEVE